MFQVSRALILCGLVFYAGVYFSQEKIWPYKPVARAFTVLSDGIRYGGFAPEHAIAEAPVGASREPYTVHDEQAVLPGFRAVMGYQHEDGGFGIRLFDTTGALVHERVIDYAAEDPDGPSAGSDAPHAFHFLRDGSVLVNFDKGDFLGRFDACGKALWSKEGAYHHSFDSDPNGGVWTWRGEKSAFSQFQYLHLFDPENGEILREIGLVEEIIGANPQLRTLFSLVPGHQTVPESKLRADPDLFHPNDLEVLSEELALVT